MFIIPSVVPILRLFLYKYWTSLIRYFYIITVFFDS